MGSVADSLDGEAGWLLLAGRDHAGIQQCLVPLRQQFRFRALSEASIDEVVAATDLSPEAAALARQREFSEPLLWQDDAQALTAFRSALQRCGCNLLKGGRFLHVIGNTDKGRAMQRLLQHYPAGPARPTVMALGDSDNDIDMLRAADIAAIIHSPLRPPPEVGDLPRLYRSKAAGAAGWAECVEQVLALQV